MKVTVAVENTADGIMESPDACTYAISMEIATRVVVLSNLNHKDTDYILSDPTKTLSRIEERYGNMPVVKAFLEVAKPGDVEICGKTITPKEQVA